MYDGIEKNRIINNNTWYSVSLLITFHKGIQTSRYVFTSNMLFIPLTHVYGVGFFLVTYCVFYWLCELLVNYFYYFL